MSLQQAASPRSAGTCRLSKKNESGDDAARTASAGGHWSCWLIGLFLLAAVAGPAQAVDVTLAWDPNTEPDLDGYTVYYSIGSPGPPYDYAGDLPLSDLADPDQPMVTLTELQEQVEYHFALTAYDTEGNESSFSNSICIYYDGILQECTPSSTAPTIGGGGGGSHHTGACFIGAAGVDNPQTGQSAGSFGIAACAVLLAIAFISFGRAARFRMKPSKIRLGRRPPPFQQ